MLIIEGAKEEVCNYTLDDAVKLAKMMMADQGLSTSAAAKEAATITSIRKSEIYKGML